MRTKNSRESRISNIRWTLLLYDLLLYGAVAFVLLYLQPISLYASHEADIIRHAVLGAVCLTSMRMVFGVYRQIWRYGDIRAFFGMLFADALGGILFFALGRLLIGTFVDFVRIVALVAIDLLAAFWMRMVYHLLYRYISRNARGSRFFSSMIRVLTGSTILPDGENAMQRARIAIVGAGTVGIALAEELTNNRRSFYKPLCFIDSNPEKIGRVVVGLPVLSEQKALKGELRRLGVQEVVFAIRQCTPEERKALFERYRDTGFKLRIYDYPVMQSAGDGRRQLREFSVEDLLFRQPVDFIDSHCADYYRGKSVMVTGGGGSIGSELCRQIAKMQPGKIIIVDICENGAYDVRQELFHAYGGDVPVFIEIVSVCDRAGLSRIFAKHRPEIVLHAAAHKHVPLMENNCCEAVKNNVFGTLNTVELAEEYGVGRFIMISTDKAVNPTNIMGATKRMCEMIVLSHGRASEKMVCSCTRFGNVLGSAGSVIPLFRRQIADGGPITVTDKRIIRYFMTIPEASQLVLQSGAMAKNGELFVLDMGKPVRILELAENMVRLCGLEPYRDIDIVETGLRPGEKLYEELLIRSEELDRTDNQMIFIERDLPPTAQELQAGLSVLRAAVETEDDETVRAALHRVVPTFRTPESVNAEAEKNGMIGTVVG